MQFGMWTKFGMELSNIKEIIENDAYLINYAWFVKTSQFDLKFGMEMSNIMEKSENDFFIYKAFGIYSWRSICRIPRGGGGGGEEIVWDIENSSSILLRYASIFDLPTTPFYHNTT